MFSSVRARLTLWYVGVLGIVLIAFSVGVYVLLARSLYDRLDARLSSTLEATMAALKPVIGHAGTLALAARALEELRFPNQTIALVDEHGRVLAERRAPGGPALRLPPLTPNPSQNLQFFELPESQPDSDDACRGAFRRVAAAPAAAVYGVVVVQSLEPLSDQLESLLDVLYIVVPLSLVAAGLVGWFLARRTLAPIAAMSEHAQRITAEDLDQRLPISNPRDELGRLAATFNDLLARLRDAFAQQRQFMADASHELRTPLSAIQTTAAVMLERENRGNSEYREALTIIRQQVQRLTRIVEDMFVLARADAERRPLRNTEFYLDELLAETARAAAMLASRKDLQLELPPLPETPFHGDEDLLRQMTWNLLDNAIKHTPEKGKFGVGLESRGREYVITFTDTGTGISPDIRPHIFERFYRGDQARSRAEAGAGTGSGAGLGLPIARWIAEAHHGRIELQRSDAAGTTFAVFLPRR